MGDLIGLSYFADPYYQSQAYREKQRALGATGNEAARAELNIARDKALAERTAR